MIIPHLETILCDTEEARDLHYQIRHQVFCEETGFESADAFPDKRERDRYDDVAVHFAILDRFRNRWVGAMRLVEGSRTPLPMESICRGKIEGLHRHRARSLELSRLSVVRNGMDADLSSLIHATHSGFVTTPSTTSLSSTQEAQEALVRLLWAAIQWAKQNEVSQIYGIVTAPLARVMKRFGIPVTAAGVEVRYRGLRRPYLSSADESEKGMVATLRQFPHVFDANRPFVPFSELTAAYPPISSTHPDPKTSTRKFSQTAA